MFNQPHPATRISPPIFDQLPLRSSSFEYAFDFKPREVRYLIRRADEGNPVLIESPTQSRRRRVKGKSEDVTACIMEVVRSRLTSSSVSKHHSDDFSMAKPATKFPNLHPYWRGCIPKRGAASRATYSRSVDDCERINRISSPGKMLRVTLPQAVPELPLLHLK